MRTRSGQGTVIIIAALFILVMAVMQIAQSYLLSQVGDQTTRSTLGRMCAVIAESAIEEAHVIMADRLNTPSDPLFAKVRTDAPAKAPGTEFATQTLAIGDLPRLSRLLATETGKNCELTELSVSLQAGRALSLNYPLEYDGTIVYKARVRSKLDRGIIRELEETQTFKVNQIALPAPLPKMPLVVRHVYSMVFGRRDGESSQNGGTDLNDLRRKIIDQHLPSVKSKYQEVMRKFNDSKARESGFLMSVKPFYEKIGNDGGVDHIAEVEKLGQETVKFPDAQGPVAPFVLLGQVEQLELASINVQALMTRRLPRLSQVVNEIDRLAGTIQRQYEAEDTSETAKQTNIQYTTLMLEELAIFKDVLGYIKSVQTQFKVFEPAANPALFSALMLQLQAVDAVQMGAAANAVAQRATHRISEEPGITVQQQWERLHKRLDTFGGGFCGLVYVDNPNEVFTLSGEVSGNLVIAVSGKLRVDGLKPKFATDTLTVIANGGGVGGGAVQLSGAIGASISTRGSALDIKPGTQIVGTLVLDEIPLTLTDGLTGTVFVDARLADTAKPPFWYVSLSPWVRSRTSQRS